MKKLVLLLLFMLVNVLLFANTQRDTTTITIQGVKYQKINIDHTLIVQKEGQELYEIPTPGHEYFYLKGEAGAFVDDVVRKHVLPVLKQKQVLSSNRGGWFQIFLVTDLEGHIKYLSFVSSHVFKGALPIKIYHELDKQIRKSEKLLGERHFKLKYKDTKLIFNRKIYATESIYKLEK